ncbi:hypothetical protein ACLOJK_022921 [Asimina triloba]
MATLFLHTPAPPASSRFSFKPSLPLLISRPLSLKHFHKQPPLTFRSAPEKAAAPICFSSAVDDFYSEDPLSKFFKPVIDSFKTRLKPSNLPLPTSPIDVCKWAAVISIAIAVVKRTITTLLNPFFWMYFSWTWLFWPWFFSIALAIYGAYCLCKQLQQKANIFEQLAIMTSAITWLTLVPPAYFNGFLEGWPFVFFFAYHYYLFFDASIRKRLYGDLYARQHDLKWDINLPNWARLLFAAAVMVAHWLAAAEAPELQLIPGGWANVAIWMMILLVQFMKYHSMYYLSKYSVKVAEPTAVVQFGPYRWVRHPIYTSVMLLFATYFAAMRAPLSLLFVVGVCLAYYDWKARLEENMMLETFGEWYKAYMNKVPYKFIPLLY